VTIERAAEAVAPGRTRGAAPSPAATDWFLTAQDRGNPATTIDVGRAEAWTAGNAAEVLVDGDAYLRRLHAVLLSARAGDTVLLAGLEMDADQRLTDEDTTLGAVLVTLLGRGVAVKALVWRSHPTYTAGRNLHFARVVNAAGGEVRLDNRIRRLGSLHQKIVVLRRSVPGPDDVAFVGGIDLSHGGHDDTRHHGDGQRAALARANYGDSPPWHDVAMMLRGPAVDDVALTFAERWNDPSPLDRGGRWRRLVSREPATRADLTVARPAAPLSPAGPHAVQVLRTYPVRRRPYPYAPNGERSIARAYLRAFARARRLVYVEDQYLWSYAATAALTEALRRQHSLRVVVVIPRYPDPAGHISGPASAVGRRHVMRALARAGGDRVAVYDLVNDEDTPIYVHSKVCVVDDEWLTVGSDNLNRRSWSHDSEICGAVVEPARPGATTLAAATRLRLAAEHLERDDLAALRDPSDWSRAFADAADAAERWVAGGRSGPRPAGRVRRHSPDGIGHVPAFVLRAAHPLVLDPEGRPRALRRADRY
jgi:phosphatidylserine/phosphatidylglycerophosphate/cardiolipin synthase-like enzyme